MRHEADTDELSDEALLEAAEFATELEIRKGANRKGGPIEDPEDYTRGVLRHLRGDHDRARALLAKKHRRLEAKAAGSASAAATAPMAYDERIDGPFPGDLRPTVKLRFGQQLDEGWSERYAASLAERRPLDLAAWIAARMPRLWMRVESFVAERGEQPIVEVEAIVRGQLRSGMRRFFDRHGDAAWNNHGVQEELRSRFVAALRVALEQPVAAPALAEAHA